MNSRVGAVTRSSIRKQREICFRVLKKHFNWQVDHIRSGEYGHPGPTAPYVYEAYMRVCTLLLYTGDVLGLIRLNEFGVVDPEQSKPRFYERVVQCLEMMHEWCIRNPPFGKQPEDDMWSTGVIPRTVLWNVTPSLRKRMMGSEIMDFIEAKGTTAAADYDGMIRDIFIEISTDAFGEVEKASRHEPVPRSCRQDVRCARVYISKSGTRDVPTIKYLSTTKSRAKWPKSERQLYWSLFSDDRNETVYSWIQSVLRNEKVEVCIKPNSEILTNMNSLSE